MSSEGNADFAVMGFCAPLLGMVATVLLSEFGGLSHGDLAVYVWAMWILILALEVLTVRKDRRYAVLLLPLFLFCLGVSICFLYGINLLVVPAVAVLSLIAAAVAVRYWH